MSAVIQTITLNQDDPISHIWLPDLHKYQTICGWGVPFSHDGIPSPYAATAGTTLHNTCAEALQRLEAIMIGAD